MQILPFNYQNRMNNIQYNNKRTTNSPTFKATLSADTIVDVLNTLKNQHSPVAEDIACMVLKEVIPQRSCGSSVNISNGLVIEMATALLSVATDALSTQKQNPNIGSSSCQKEVDNTFCGEELLVNYEYSSPNSASNHAHTPRSQSSGGTGSMVLEEPSGYSRRLDASDIDHVEQLGPNWTRVYRRGSGQKYNDVNASASEVESMLKSSGNHIVKTDYAGV